MNNSFDPQLTKQVIIGTKSQSRRKIFKLMNLRFQYRSPNISEKKVKDLNNDKYDALKIAKAKAEHLSKKYSNKIIITFDTTILFKKNTVYKCKTKKCCKNLIKSFSGRHHYLYTGMVFMINNKIIHKKLTETKVIFKNNNNDTINRYVDKNFIKIKSAVGCYNLEGKGSDFFENIYASYYNVLGLDIIHFLKSLKKL